MGPGCQSALGYLLWSTPWPRRGGGPGSQAPLHPCSCRRSHTCPLHSRAFPQRCLCTFAHTEPLNTLRGPQWSMTSQGVWETRTRTCSIPGQACPTLTSEPCLLSSEPAPDHIGKSGCGPKPHKALWPKGKQASPLRTTFPWALDTVQTLGSAIRVPLTRATQGPQPSLCSHLTLPSLPLSARGLSIPILEKQTLSPGHISTSLPPSAAPHLSWSWVCGVREPARLHPTPDPMIL